MTRRRSRTRWPSGRWQTCKRLAELDRLRDDAARDDPICGVDPEGVPRADPAPPDAPESILRGDLSLPPDPTPRQAAGTGFTPGSAPPG